MQRNAFVWCCYKRNSFSLIQGDEMGRNRLDVYPASGSTNAIYWKKETKQKINRSYIKKKLYFSGVTQKSKASFCGHRQWQNICSCFRSDTLKCRFWTWRKKGKLLWIKVDLVWKASLCAAAQPFRTDRATTELRRRPRPPCWERPVTYSHGFDHTDRRHTSCSCKMCRREICTERDSWLVSEHF